MPESVPASPDTPPRPTGRMLVRRRLLAVVAAAPAAIAIAKASGGFTPPASPHLLENAATDTLDLPAGAPCYFC